jgi:threonine dehydrogenase-like Zn-dependent dehydrogenase
MKGKNMHALVFDGKNVALRDVPCPKISDPHDVMVEIALTGICGTDLNVLKGKFDANPGVIMGHEAVGVVADVGSAVTRIIPGDRVVIDPTMWCGHCEMCRLRRYNLCHHKRGREVGLDFPGTFARFSVFPETFVYALPETMSFERAVMIEPLACVLNNFEAAAVASDDAVLVLGGGPIGSLSALYGQKVAATYMVTELDSYRVESMREMGLIAVQTDAEVQAGHLRALTEAQMGCTPTVIFDTTGLMTEVAIETVDRGGRVVAMGFNKRARATLSPLYLTNNAIRLIGAGDYNASIQKAIQVAQGLALEKLVTNKYSLMHFETAFDSLLQANGVPARNMKAVFDLTT